MKRVFDIIITRHPALVEYLREEGIVDADIRVEQHASPEAVSGKHVIGVLPHSLSCLTASFSEIPLSLKPEQRGRELALAEVREAAGALVTYNVTREPDNWYCRRCGGYTGEEYCPDCGQDCDPVYKEVE